MILAAVLLTAAPAFARIKMTALPQRERVEIQLDHGRYTLVEEERIVPLLASNARRGNNFVDFSWSNTQIDKDSIQFRPIAIREGDGFRPIANGEVAVINVTYPPNENALVWGIHAKGACAVKARVSYLIRNLDRRFAYRAKANKAETTLFLRKYLQLRNYSGEDFGEAGIWAGFGPHFSKHGRLNADKPFASRVLIHYELANDEGHGLGRYPLQPGKVRIFIDDGHGGEAFLGEDWAGLTPIDAKLRLFLGEARDIVCERKVEKNVRHRVRGNRFNQEIVLRYECRNFKKKAATLDITEQLNRLCAQYAGDPRGDVEWELGPQTSEGLRITYEQYFLGIEKREPTFVLHLTLKHIW